MAASVAQFAQVSDWQSNSTSKTITGLAWSSGDRIVVFGALANADGTLATPTNANLTFSAVSGASIGTGAGNECECIFWSASAGSSQTSQTITIGITIVNASFGGGCAWVITGSPTGITNGTANQTESTISLTVSASSIVIYGFGDWTANTTDQTAATGSGTVTERVDTGDGINYGICAYDWVGVSAGTFGFGVSSYTGLKVAHAVVEVTGPAAAAFMPAEPLVYSQAVPRAANW